MTRFTRFLRIATLVSIPVLTQSHPISDGMGASPSNSSWAAWSVSQPSSSSVNTFMPEPSSPTVDGSVASIPDNNTIPAYTNTPETLDDAFTIEYFLEFNFSTTSPEPYDPSLPSPDGPLMARMAADESDIPAYFNLDNSTASAVNLTANINSVLQNAGLNTSNSVIATALLSSLSGTTNLAASQNQATQQEMAVFLQSCLLDYDSCLFYDENTMEIVEATIAMAGSHYWDNLDENGNVWASIAQWVLDLGVDVLVGDRVDTNDMVVPLIVAPGGEISVSLPALVPSSDRS